MSVSPAPSDDQQEKTQEQITFRFCRECSNMLYPKEDRNTNKLMFACRTCQFSEEAQSSCVFRNNLYNTVGETAGVTQDVGSDPTVGLPDFCTLCGQEVVCFYCGGEECSDSTGVEEIENDDLFEEVEVDSGYESTEIYQSLPRSNKQCPNCHETEAVFFQSQQRSAETGMKLFYVCCSCGNIFQ